MTSFIIAPVWHDRRRNYGRLLFPPVSFVPVHLDSWINRSRLLVWHARISSRLFTSLGPAQVGPFLFARSPAPIPSSHLQQPRRPAAARPPCEAGEAFGGRIYRAKRNADQTPTPASIATKTALTESQRPPRARLAPTAAHDSRPASEALGGQPQPQEA